MATSGVYKTTNGGTTFTPVFDNETTGSIGAIAIAPTDANLVWVGTGEGNNRQSSSWGEGVFKSTELVMDPSNNKTLYAASYQRRRQQWGMNGGGTGSAIWKSTDAGQTWSKLETGVPAGAKGRIGLDIYRRDPNVLYARIEHPTESGVYRSDNAGAT